MLLAHKHADIRHKINMLQHHRSVFSSRIENQHQKKQCSVGTRITTAETIDNTPLQEVNEFVYLDFDTRKNGETVADVTHPQIKTGIQQTEQNLKQLNNNVTSLPDFDYACVRSVTLYSIQYEYETWKVKAVYATSYHQ